MSSIWDRFDDIVKAEEVVEAKIQSQPVEAGNYEATLISAEAGETKNTNLPAMKLAFALGSGKKLYVTQVLQNLNYPDMTKVNVSKACDLVEDLTGEDYKFTSLSQLAKDINALPVGTNYIIEVSYEARDTEQKYAKVKVLEILGVDMDDSDVPF